MGPNRRRFLQYSALASTAASSLLLTACSGGSTPAPADPQNSGTGVADHAGTAGLVHPSVVQFIAHPDDDLYFMNPETWAAAAAGVPLLSVCLTAGEAGGVDADPAEQRSKPTPPDRSAYSAARMAGARRSYAKMLTGNAESPWSRRALNLGHGLVAEQATLEAMPHVRLVFLAMLEALDGRPQFKNLNLWNLWTGHAAEVPTIPITDSPVRAGGSYSREALIGVLGTLLAQSAPTLVRIMDHDPEHIVKPKGGLMSGDHIDHTSSALFALEAVRRYSATSGHAPLVQSYRGYSNAIWPRNLDDPTRDAKYRDLMVYSGFGQRCTGPISCGDHNLDGLKITDRRMGSTRARYPGDTSWLQRLPDGRLAAFGVRAGHAVMWTQTAAGANHWSGPTQIAGPASGDGLVGQIGAVRQADGRLRVFALELTQVGTAFGQQVRSVVTAVQSTPGGAFGGWQSLGGPDGVDAVKNRELGLPYAAVDGAGWVHVVARTWSRALAIRSLDPSTGNWSDWRALAGTGVADVQDDLALLRRADGTVNLFAGSRTVLLQWTIKAAAVSAPSVLPLPVPSAAPAPVELPDGELVLFLRVPGSETVLAARQGAHGGAWNTADTSVHLEGSFGRIAALPYGRGAKDVILMTRDAKGLATAADWTAGAGLTQSWVSAGPLHAGAPALAVDGSGSIVCATIGVDGLLHTTVTAKGAQVAAQMAS